MISIVTPVYNAAGFIEDTLKMVPRQDYKDWEWILVEDGSTDNTRQILKEYEASPDRDVRIKILFLDDNGHGAAGARNRGLDAATGRYIAFLDADDVWKDDKLSRQLAFMEKTRAAFTFTSYEFGDENAIGTGKIVKAPDSLSYKQALSRTVIFTSTTMFDIDKIDKDKIYMPYIASEDTAAWWNILRGGVVARGLNEVLTIYRRPVKSLSSNKFVAIKRIWALYRQYEGLGVCASACYFVGWAVRATLRRL